MTKSIKARIKEPSTWAGLGMLVPTVVTALATGFTPTIAGQLAAGLFAVLLPESAKAK